jgi:predicted nucleic acid-binding protein
MGEPAVIVPDTTVWIDYSKGVRSSQTDLLSKELSYHKPIVTDVIILEFLQGFRDDGDHAAGFKLMREMIYKSFWGRRNMEQAAANYRFLRKQGVTIRSPNDIIIGTFCIENGFFYFTTTATLIQWNGTWG